MKGKKRKGTASSRFTRGIKVSSKKRSGTRRSSRKSRENPDVMVNVPSRSLEDSLN